MTRPVRPASVPRLPSTSDQSLGWIVAGNLLPVFGVLVLGWRVVDVVAVYWLETAIIGAYAFLRLATKPAWSLLWRLPVFTLVFSFLLAGLGLVLHFAFTGDLDPLDGGVSNAMIYAGFAFATSHGITFVNGWLRGGERERTPHADIPKVPYARLAILPFVILVGSFAAFLFGDHSLTLFLLILLKTAIDVAGPAAERYRDAPEWGEWRPD